MGLLVYCSDITGQSSASVVPNEHGVGLLSHLHQLTNLPITRFLILLLCTLHASQLLPLCYHGLDSQALQDSFA